LGKFLKEEFEHFKKERFCKKIKGNNEFNTRTPGLAAPLEPPAWVKMTHIPFYGIIGFFASFLAGSVFYENRTMYECPSNIISTYIYGTL